MGGIAMGYKKCKQACQVIVKDESKLADVPMDIVIKNLPVFTEVKLVLELENYYCINAPMKLDKSVKWQSSAVFLTSADGEIILSQSPAIRGDYSGINQMALFERLHPEKMIRSSTTTRFNEIPLNDSFDCQLFVYQDEQLLGKCSFKRYYLQKNLTFQNVTLERAVGRVFYGKEWKKAPAIIVLSGSEGGIEKAQNIAQLLASRGYVTLALAYFGIDGLSNQLKRIPLEIIEEALNYLKNLKCVDSNRIGLYGRSKGAEFGLLAACYFNALKVLVLNAPTDCVFEGINGIWPSGTSSWTYRGLELAYTKFQWLHYLFEIFTRKRKLHKNDASLFPVEKLTSSVLFIASIADEVWDAYGAVKNIRSRVGSDCKYAFLVTPHLGHMNTVSYQPNLRYKKMDPDLLQEDTRISWNATLEQFKKL